jgi:hypothetical protein
MDPKDKPNKPTDSHDEPSKVHAHSEEHSADLPAGTHGHDVAHDAGHGHGELAADYIPEGAPQDKILVLIAALALCGILAFMAMVFMGPAHKEGHDATGGGAPHGAPAVHGGAEINNGVHGDTTNPSSHEESAH